MKCKSEQTTIIVSGTKGDHLAAYIKERFLQFFTAPVDSLHFADLVYHEAASNFVRDSNDTYGRNYALCNQLQVNLLQRGTFGLRLELVWCRQ